MRRDLSQSTSEEGRTKPASQPAYRRIWLYGFDPDIAVIYFNIDVAGTEGSEMKGHLGGPAQYRKAYLLTPCWNDTGKSPADWQYNLYATNLFRPLTPVTETSLEAASPVDLELLQTTYPMLMSKRIWEPEVAVNMFSAAAKGTSYAQRHIQLAEVPFAKQDPSAPGPKKDESEKSTTNLKNGWQAALEAWSKKGPGGSKSNGRPV